MYVCMYACMCVCMYVYIYIYIYVYVNVYIYIYIYMANATAFTTIPTKTGNARKSCVPQHSLDWRPQPPALTRAALYKLSLMPRGAASLRPQLPPRCPHLDRMSNSESKSLSRGEPVAKRTSPSGPADSCNRLCLSRSTICRSSLLFSRTSRILNFYILQMLQLNLHLLQPLGSRSCVELSCSCLQFSRS